MRPFFLKLNISLGQVIIQSKKVRIIPTRLGVRAFQSCQGVWHYSWVFRVYIFCLLLISKYLCFPKIYTKKTVYFSLLVHQQTFIQISQYGSKNVNSDKQRIFRAKLYLWERGKKIRVNICSSLTNFTSG